MRRTVAVLLLLGVPGLGCDVGESGPPPDDPATRAVDPAPTEGEEFLEFGDTGAQPDALPGGGAAPVPTSRYRLRVTADGCTVRRGGGAGLDGLAWLLNSADGTVTDPRGDRTTFHPRLRGTGVVSVVLLDKTAGGMTVHQVSNTVRVHCP
jgi:hypothetical protein